MTTELSTVSAVPGDSVVVVTGRVYSSSIIWIKTIVVLMSQMIGSGMLSASVVQCSQCSRTSDQLHLT